MHGCTSDRCNNAFALCPSTLVNIATSFYIWAYKLSCFYPMATPSFDIKQKTWAYFLCLFSTLYTKHDLNNLYVFLFVHYTDLRAGLGRKCDLPASHAARSSHDDNSSRRSTT
jgi:hypothetical protein